jgi:adenosyl cobinamide kinase/adenosyl cobinamide phosphate guanylyltransferase
MLLGGARSGKSALAVRLGRAYQGPVVLVATCPRVDGDAELAIRIDAHRDERPGAWSVVEEEQDLAAAVAAAGDALCLVDCLTLWVANLLHHGASATDVAHASDAALVRVGARTAPTVVVSNEVGLGIVPADSLSRTYRDALGRVNQAWAAAADRAILMVAGRALPLGDPLGALGGR